jgi:type IV pilus assembly protein PilA
MWERKQPLNSNKERLKTMKTTFTAKYLQHLVSKKKKNEGFTLIELLVVIIIVGVLAAIALPSFLNQIGKARGSEAKSNIGTINRSQQAYRLENSTMANAVTLLDSRISGKFYTYAIGVTNANNATATATLGTVATDLKNYGGAVVQVPAAGTVQEFFGSVVCETLNNNATAVAGVAPTVPNTQGTCAGANLVD